MQISKIQITFEQVGPINSAIVKAIAIAKLYNCSVEFIFNHSKLSVTPTSTLNEIKHQYSQFLKTLH